MSYNSYDQFFFVLYLLLIQTCTPYIGQTAHKKKLIESYVNCTKKAFCDILLKQSYTQVLYKWTRHEGPEGYGKKPPIHKCSL